MMQADRDYWQKQSAYLANFALRTLLVTVVLAIVASMLAVYAYLRTC